MYTRGKGKGSWDKAKWYAADSEWSMCCPRVVSPVPVFLIVYTQTWEFWGRTFKIFNSWWLQDLMPVSYSIFVLYFKSLQFDQYHYVLVTLIARCPTWLLLCVFVSSLIAPHVVQFIGLLTTLFCKVDILTHKGSQLWRTFTLDVCQALKMPFFLNDDVFSQLVVMEYSSISLLRSAVFVQFSVWQPSAVSNPWWVVLSGVILIVWVVAHEPTTSICSVLENARHCFGSGWPAGGRKLWALRVTLRDVHFVEGGVTVAGGCP